MVTAQGFTASLWVPDSQPNNFSQGERDQSLPVLNALLPQPRSSDHVSFVVIASHDTCSSFPLGEC